LRARERSGPDHLLTAREYVTPVHVVSEVALRDVPLLHPHPVIPLCHLGETFDLWKEEVVRMWRFTKNNCITEGFHAKMEMISRRAFGFRNLDNYRLRVSPLCPGGSGLHTFGVNAPNGAASWGEKNPLTIPGLR